jgi:hypothetical protein
MDQVINSDCFGKGWDVQTDAHCIDCGAKNKCKDTLLHGIFHETVSANPAVNNEQLAQAFTISLPSIDVLRQEYNEFMGNQSPPTPPQIPQVPSTPPQVPQIAPSSPPQVSIPLQVPSSPQVLSSPVPRPIPCKNRRGRQPSDLVVCPYCDNGYGSDGNACAVCGGYGNISAKKLEAYQKQEAKSQQVVEGASTIAINPQSVTRNGPPQAVEGGNSSSAGVQGVLPVQRASVSNAVQSSPENSGKLSQTQASEKTGKTSKRSKTVSGLERSSIFSIDQLLSLSDGTVKTIFFNNETGEMSLTMGLK